MCENEARQLKAFTRQMRDQTDVEQHFCRRFLTCSGARPETVRCTRGSLKES